MEVDITYTDSVGRRHSDAGGMLEAEMERIVDDHLASMKQTIEGTRCEIHDETPVATYAKEPGKASFHVSGCCEDLVLKAEAAAGLRQGMDLEPGKRYRAHMPEHGGLIEVTYLGLAPSIVMPEGGGQDLLIPNARVQMPDGTEEMVIEAALSELDQDA